tara:strand:- start:5556 stop:5882 length:327 start_codon:yes stop_codon:yes gene_type:complete
MPQIEARTRGDIAEFLPHAIQTALESYKSFSSQDVPEAPKDFKAHHDACKVAIAHIELLIKLAKLADLPASDSNDQDDQALLLGLIENAEGELRLHQKGAKFDFKGKD